jgi:hypothetical protein
MKNAYLYNHKQAKEQEYRKGIVDGMDMGFNLVAIALNHKFGFGEQRLSQLEAAVQALVDEIVDTNDPLVTQVHIETAVKQIRGDKYVWR